MKTNHRNHQLVGLFMWSLCGCATIVGGGTTQLVTFDSAPAGADVVVSGKRVGVTPTSIQLKRESDVVVKITKEGYQPQQFQLQTKMNPWFWGNFISGGLIGSTTDAVSGAVTKYEPSSYFVTLSPQAASTDERESWLREEELRRYVLVTYSHLAEDLASGRGEYLDALCTRLQRTSHDEATLARLRALLYASQTIPEFAAGVVDMLSSQRG